MFLLNEMRKFQTKKKSFSFVWVTWACMLAAIIVVMNSLALVQLGVMSRKAVRFVNFRLPVFEDFVADAKDSENSIDLNEKTPLIYIGAKSVVVGSSLDVVAPKPDGDLSMIDRRSWDESHLEKITSRKQLSKFFPTKLIALSLDDEIPFGDYLEIKQRAMKNVVAINAHFSRVDERLVPAVVLLASKKKLFASSHEEVP